MTHTLKNESLALQVESRGAEIVSLKTAQGREAIWYGEPRYWDRHAPLLFPCVGGNWEGQIRVEGQAYPLVKHGFVQDMEFELVEQTAERLTLSLCDTPATRQSFPFAFRLTVSYTLQGNTLDVTWKVENPAETTMSFMIGAHPAFLLPKFSAEDAVHGYLRFPEVDCLRSTPTLPRGYTHPEQEELFPLEDHLLPLTNQAFLCDTILDTTGRISRVELLDASRQRLITMQFQMPVLAMWAPEGGCSPFVCIEPWYGLCDTEGYTGEFSDRPYINNVRAHETWECKYSMTVE
ncbi:MAG: aldose 1-epimerase family protein [Bacteroidaceae bacterium]|nr:aldose 1-epimerase family protein [Bacteroidaceae bacterium]